MQKRVLVVDDDADIRAMLGFALQCHALTVDEACDGNEALALMKDHQYAVVILDLLMPNLDGAGVLDAMNRPDLAPPPVVLVITGAERSEIARLDPRRIHGVMRKPFDPEELAEVVAACAEIRSRAPFGTMAIATMIAGGPLLALLNRFQG